MATKRCYCGDFEEYWWRPVNDCLPPFNEPVLIYIHEQVRIGVFINGQKVSECADGILPNTANHVWCGYVAITAKDLRDGGITWWAPIRPVPILSKTYPG